MQLFSHKNRPVHLGPLPMERLRRASGSPIAQITSDGLLNECFKPGELGYAMSQFLCALDSARDGAVSPPAEGVPSEPRARSEHLKAAAYFLDSAVAGVTAIDATHVLAKPHQHARLGTLSFQASKEKLRLRFSPIPVIRQMEQALILAKRPIDHHKYALVIVNDFPRDADANVPGEEWMLGLQPWRAALRAAETACVLANYLRMMGFDARAHSATTSNFNLHRLAVSAGLAQYQDGVVTNPFIGERFAVAAVTTNMELATDLPIGQQSLADRWRAKGISWWLGSSAPRSASTVVDMKGRPYEHSRYPTEKLKRVDKPTTFIDEERIPRVPKSSEMFVRAGYGDLGKPAREASRDGHCVGKPPIASALRLALNIYSLLQRGEEAPTKVPGYTDPARNNALMKATIHWLGADLAGVSRAPAWVWYSHSQDGKEMKVAHPRAVSVMIDQGYETMEGASGDDWISSAQSMRTYMRAALVCGVLGYHLRQMGYSATAHSAADSDVIQTPLVLLAGLGEVSRIGETILNPFLGPRLKTGILTTDFPMTEDKAIDFGLQTFCEGCNKCARECPSGAITAGPKVMFNGYEIWKADTAKCTQYRVTNLGGAMCGRCMKTCPWNLAGLFQEKPFQWLAMNFPKMARAIAWLDDKLDRGTINPVKKWWWDLARDQADGKIKPATVTNSRELQKEIKITRAEQTLALYPAHLVPPPIGMPWPLNREAGIEAYEKALSPTEYQARLARGETKDLVTQLVDHSSDPPAYLCKVTKRWRGSADGKIDIFRLERADGKPMPAYEAGAHVDLLVGSGCEVIRQYSLASDPGDLSHYLVGVLREDQGHGGSKKLHEMMYESAPVVVSKPRNHFPIADGKGRHLLMAGGIGVTPLIAMAHQLWREGRPFELYYKARTRAQAAFIPELQAMPWAQHVHFHFSDEDRLDISTVLCHYSPGDHVYTCGPASFMDAVFATSTKFGWPEDAMHREYFSVPETPDYVNHEFEIQLRSSGQVIKVAATEKATEALVKAGISVDVKCSDGLCGVCMAKYVSGTVEHRDYVLSKSQRDTSMILCCSRSAEPNGRIVLDR